MRTAIVTGSDHGYFHLMSELLRTLARSAIDFPYELCVLDLGMTAEENREIEAFDAKVVRPDWWFEMPDDLRIQRNFGYAARPVIPDYFPGFETYLWLDADISVQDGRFASDFVRHAETGALAIAEEADPSYRRELYALKWHVGNALRCFGLVDGLRVCMTRPINAGLFALRADAPHWAVWRRRYKDAVERAGRANLDQHTLAATLCLDGLPVSYLDSTHNWICARSQPLWDDERQVFCRPHSPHDPISVLHLAGREKGGLRQIKTLSGDVRSMPLTYTPSTSGFGETEAVGA